MRFDFTCPIMISEHLTACEVEGCAEIEGNDDLDWSITDILIYQMEHDSYGERPAVAISTTHILWQPIMLHLLSKSVRDEITDEFKLWQWPSLTRHGREKLEESGPTHRIPTYGA